MKQPKIPTLQHLARNWHPHSKQVQKKLVNLVKAPPFFNYNPLYGAVEDLLYFKQPVDEICLGLKRKVSRPKVLKNFLEVVPLLADHFDQITPDFVQAVDRRYYPVGQGLMVPFDPPLIYGVGGQIYFPWFSFWRSDPLDSERLSLFVTIVFDILSQDPDLDEAVFEVLDFSVPKGPKNALGERTLTVIKADDVARLSDQRVTEMLEIFAQGYLNACAELSGPAEEATNEQPGKQEYDPNQPGLFD